MYNVHSAQGADLNLVYLYVHKDDFALILHITSSDSLITYVYINSFKYWKG